MTNTSEPQLAERPATCPACSNFIKVGDEITRDNAFANWRHVRCPHTKYDFDPADVCPDCFTVRTPTGACNCA
ncbi:hypothetical protein ACWGR3_28825 [Streptomyces albidoflavus]